MVFRSVTPPNEWTRRGVAHCIRNPGEGRALEARILGRSVPGWPETRDQIAAGVNATNLRSARETAQRKF